MSDFVIPDMIEPIVAWRTWNAAGNVLQSLNRGDVWPRQERMVATCPSSEPTMQKMAGWEAVPHRGEPVWLREEQSHEDLFPGRQHIYNGAGQVVGTVMSSSVAVMPAPVMHLDPPPDKPSELLLPVGWTFRIAMRDIMLPPLHTEAPAESCSCGIYALKSRAAAVAYGQHTSVLGEVYLWGKVIEGEDGYRAQYAYPKSLTIRHRDHDGDGELGEYGVPVHEDQNPLGIVVPRAIARRDAMSRVMLSALALNGFAIVMVISEFALGVVAWWNVALLVCNVIAIGVLLAVAK